MTASSSRSPFDDVRFKWGLLVLLSLAAPHLMLGAAVGWFAGGKKFPKKTEVFALTCTFLVLLVTALVAVPAARDWYLATYWSAHLGLFRLRFEWGGLVLGFLPVTLLVAAVAHVVKKEKDDEPVAAKTAEDIEELHSLTLYRKDRKETHKLRWVPRRPVIGVPVFEFDPFRPSPYELRRRYVEERTPIGQKPTAELELEASEWMWKNHIEKRTTLVLDPRFSTLVVGPPDSGKSSNLAIPLTISPAYDQCKLVVCSTKDELMMASYGHRSRIGRCTLYDPVGETKLHSQRWSFLDGIREYGDAMRVAHNLVSQSSGMRDGGSDGNSQYFKNTAEMGLAPLLLAAVAGKCDLATLIKWVNEPLQTFNDGTVRRLLENSGLPGADRAISAFEGQFQNPDGRIWGQTYATIKSTLVAFNTYESVLESADTTKGDVFSAEEFLLSPTPDTHYLTSSRTTQDELRPLFVAHLEDLIRTAERVAKQNGGSLPMPLVVIIDEAANSAPLPSLPTLLATARSADITVITFWQGIDQIHARYGSEAETVVNASLTKIVLPGASDSKTLELVDRLSGQTIEESRSETIDDSGDTKSQSISMSRVSLLPVYKVRQLRKGMGAVCHDNLPWVFIDTIPWYVDPELRERGSLPGPKPLPPPPKPRRQPTPPAPPPAPAAAPQAVGSGAAAPKVPSVHEQVAAKRREIERDRASLSAKLRGAGHLEVDPTTVSALSAGMAHAERVAPKALARSQRTRDAVATLNDLPALADDFEEEVLEIDDELARELATEAAMDELLDWNEA